MQPEALLFDLDGTLADGAAAIHDAFEHALRVHDHAPVARVEIGRRIGMPLRWMFRDLLSVDDEAAAALVRTYRERFESRAHELIRPAPGAHEALAAFPDVPMAIVTTKAVEPARVTLRALGMSERFSVVVGVDTVRRPKPDPEPVRVALARLGLGAQHAVFVGDTVMDVVAGRGAFAKTVAVLNGHGDPHELKAARPDALIPDLHHLPDAVNRL